MLFADGVTTEEKRPLLDFRPLAGNMPARPAYVTCPSKDKTRATPSPVERETPARSPPPVSVRSAMALSVEDNVLRCFKKFGEKVTGQAARPRMKWHSTSLYKPATGVGGKLVDSGAAVADAGPAPSAL